MRVIIILLGSAATGLFGLAGPIVWRDMPTGLAWFLLGVSALLAIAWVCLRLAVGGDEASSDARTTTYVNSSGQSGGITAYTVDIGGSTDG